MKRRSFIFLVLTLVIVVLCTSCTEQETSTTVTLDEKVASEIDVNAIIEELPSPYSVNIYSTRSDQEYLRFLTIFDNRLYDIVDISTSMYNNTNQGETYMITYIKKDKPDETAPQAYKYYIFKTRLEEAYLDFYSTLNFDKYEIVDISALLAPLDSVPKRDSYVVTYREPI